MLSENGKTKRKKSIIKCDKCKQRFEIDVENIIKLGDLSYIECPFCGQEHILRR